MNTGNCTASVGNLLEGGARCIVCFGGHELNVPPGARRAFSSQTSWKRTPPMGQEDQLHHLIIYG